MSLFRKRLLLLPLLCVSLCSPLAAAAADKPQLLASIEPLSMLARELFAQRVRVHTLLRPSQNPHHASFSPAQLRLLKRADLLLWLGAAAEPYLTKYLSVRQGPQLTLLAQPHVSPLDETHVDPHHAEHGGVDPHLWTDPKRMEKLLPALVSWGVSQGLDAKQLKKRAQRLKQRLDNEVATAKKQLAPLADTPWLSYHNPWHYFQQRLGISAPLTVVSQPGANTGSRHFLRLAQQMAQQQVHCALLEPEARVALIDKLCQAPGCQMLPLDPLGRDSKAATYSQWWRGLVQQFRQCLVL